jgi:hypothetical protein
MKQNCNAMGIFGTPRQQPTSWQKKEDSIIFCLLAYTQDKTDQGLDKCGFSWQDAIVSLVPFGGFGH